MTSKNRFLWLGVFAAVCFLSFYCSDVYAKKKIKKRPGVKYTDLNVVKGIRKEVYLNFPLGTIWGPSDTNVFQVTPEKKKDNPNLAKDRLVFKGTSTQQQASSDLWVYDENNVLKIVYNVTVTNYNIKRIYGFLKREFRNIEGLKMYIREDKIVLDGEILLPDDIARINQVITGFQPIFKVQYRLSPTLFKVVAEKMEKEIGLPDIHVDVINEKFILKGMAEDDYQLEYIVNKAMAYLPKYFYQPDVNLPSAGGSLVEPNADSPINYDFLKVKQAIEKPKKLIKIVVYFVEISKGFDEKFQFSWAPSITDDSKATATWSTQKATTDPATGDSLNSSVATITGIISNFIPKLTNAVNTKRGRIIQTSAITVENDTKGSVSKKTSYPYLVVTQTATDTKFFEVGLDMEITPKILGMVDSSQDIQLPVTISVSQLVSMSASGMPVTTGNKVSTIVNLKSGDTAAIGGIVQNTGYKGYTEGTQDAKLNPIIDLTRSKSFQRDKTQFVIFITPEIISSAVEGSKKAKESFNVK